MGVTLLAANRGALSDVVLNVDINIPVAGRKLVGKQPQLMQSTQYKQDEHTGIEWIRHFVSP